MVFHESRFSSKPDTTSRKHKRKPNMYAHYYTGKVNGQKLHLVTISSTPAPRDGTTYKVADKKAARALAKQYNAAPWNF